MSARWKILKLINGNYEQSYRDAPACARQIYTHNLGSLALVSRKADETFNGMLVAFEALLQRFVHSCRPLIGLNGCFLKRQIWRSLPSCLCIRW